MARDIDEPKAQKIPVGSGEFQVREAEIDRYSATFLFGQTVGINTGQSLHQRGFPVVNVSGGADNDGFHFDCQYIREKSSFQLLALSL